MFMAQKTGKKKLGADLDAEAVDRFGAWCDVFDVRTEVTVRPGAIAFLADLCRRPNF